MQDLSTLELQVIYVWSMDMLSVSDRAYLPRIDMIQHMLPEHYEAATSRVYGLRAAGLLKTFTRLKSLETYSGEWMKTIKQGRSLI